jgi:hypothetical protein
MGVRAGLDGGSERAPLALPKAQDRPGGVLRVAGGGRPNLIDQLAWKHCVRVHLLPRYAIGSAFAVVGAMVSARVRRAAWLSAAPFGLGVGVAVTALCSADAARWIDGRRIGAFHLDGYGWASLAVALGYLLIAVVAARAPETAWLWVLRPAAGAAVGVLGLAAVTTTWWQADGRTAVQARWVAAGVMALAAFGYLLAEAANHRIGSVRTTMCRTALVFAIAAVHAFAVSLIALRWIIPVITDDGAELAGWWLPDLPHHGVVAPGQPLAFAAAWSLASGVFLQLLWLDEPITAPLAHLEWRRTR